jgi:catechol 2,3-dioxygenase-like lactoylglutathione lyase family enzyme
VGEFSIKTVIRCADYAASRAFYADVLGLESLGDWDTPQGKGCIFGFGEKGSGGQLELFELTPADPRFVQAFREPVVNDKVDVQLATPDLAGWMERLKGVWEYEGPIEMPWGEKRIRLRDPDGLLVILHDEVGG